MEEMEIWRELEWLCLWADGCLGWTGYGWLCLMVDADSKGEGATEMGAWMGRSPASESQPD